ncbi:MAG: hypothetical protein KKH40_07890 [Nanoarchaeota archaeon]|nr:hypothetical protein [Nanoarchaeota archaeon]
MNETTSVRIAATTINTVILVMMLFLIIPLTNAIVTITDTTIPNTISEGQNTTISFSAETDDNESINYYIMINEQMVSETNSYLFQTNYTAAGSYKVKLIANTSKSFVVEEKTIQVTNNDLDIDIISPLEQTYSLEEFSIEIMSAEATVCSYEINNTEQGLLTKQTNTFSKTTTLNEGNYNLTVTCEVGYEEKESSVLFSIDLSAPIIEDFGPNNDYPNAITGSVVTLEIETNEVAVCRYDLSDKDYAVMQNTFINTNSKNHYSQISSLAQGEHTYFVRCKDLWGNKMSYSQRVSFFTNKKPTAVVDIDKSPPLKQGKYEITLTTSEDVQETPTLLYNFQDDAGKKTISLTGSGSVWEGYLIIDSKSSETIGTFYFSGKDLTNLEGTEITSGKLFEVDTVNPLKIDSLEIEQDSNDLILEWYFDDEEIDKFKIYRSTDGSVSLNDLYDSTKSTYYKDRGVDEGVTYYYKVSAVDDAGNEGSLSNMANARIEPELISAEPLSAKLSAKVDQKITLIESHIMDLDWSLKSLEQETDGTKIDVIDILSLVAKTKAIKTNLEKIKTDLVKLKNQDVNEEILDSRLDKIKEEIETQTEKIIKSVTITDRLDYEQVFDEAALSQATNEYSSLKKQAVNNIWLKEAETINEKTTINTKIFLVKVDYLSVGLDDSINRYTIIKKLIVVPNGFSDLSVVEIIDKEFESNAENIIFERTPIILKKDPVVEWLFNELDDSSITYYLEEDITLSRAKKTKTFILPKLVTSAFSTSSSDNIITGLVSDDVSENSSVSFTFIATLFGVVVIAGLLVYYVFFLRDDFDELKSPIIVKNHLSLNKTGVVVNKTPRVVDGSIVNHLFELLNKANKHADALDFKRVSSIYKSAINLYESLDDSELRIYAKNIRLELGVIYSKILIFHKLILCQELLNKQDLSKFSKELYTLERLMNLHSDKSDLFFLHAKDLFQHFVISSISFGNS